ncbi:putative Carboxypeptidase B, partial [Daphnia magna]
MWNERQIPDEPIDVLVPPQSRKKLNSKLADRKIPIHYSRLIKKTTDFCKTAYNLDWTSYHRLSNIYAFLTYLNTTYPRLVQLINIGSSYEKRPLYVIRISSSPSPGTRPAIWIDGGFHAREWISPAVATYIIQQLVEVPANAKLLSNVDWYIMPVVNPDGFKLKGYEYSHTRDRLWRKTRSMTSNPACRGVDPNRNFGYK